MRDELVVFVEDRHAPREICNDQIRSALVHMAGTAKLLSHHADELPVEGEELEAAVLAVRDRKDRLHSARVEPDAVRSAHLPRLRAFASPGPRSEERRVGKECRSRWSTYHYKNN